MRLAEGGGRGSGGGGDVEQFFYLPLCCRWLCENRPGGVDLGVCISSLLLILACPQHTHTHTLQRAADCCVIAGRNDAGSKGEGEAVLPK